MNKKSNGKSVKKTLKPIQFTQEGYDQLQVNFDQLTQERKGAVETLAQARALGDLSENGLYTAAKARLRSIDGRLFQLEMMMKLGYVEKTSATKVGIGSVVLFDDGKQQKTLTLVGAYEADPLNGKITEKSPIGQALFGKSVGDTVDVPVPAGTQKLKILKIS